MKQAHAPALLCVYVAALLTVAAIRYSAGSASPLAALAPLATWLYIAIVVIALNTLPATGITFNRFGFVRLRWQHLGLGLLGLLVVQLLDWSLAPLWESLAGGGRDLSRFEAIAGSPAELARLLALSWTVAAFGEELAFRILLLQGLITVLGPGRGTLVLAVTLQATVFAAVHAYQGPVAVIETFISGLVYGAITVLGGYAIWPAALAHGAGNTVGLLRLYFAS